MTLPNQRAEDIRQLAEDNYLETNRQIERKRLEISRIERQKATLVTEVRALEETAKEFRRAALGEASQ